jgi:hypothetical protein
MNDTEPLVFSSVLDVHFRSDLEGLLFFNPNQGQYASAITRAVEQFGSPQIVMRDGSLRILMQSNVQTLYVLIDGQAATRLVGVVIYTIQPTDTISIIHLAVDTEFSAVGKKADRMIVLAAINELRQIGKSIKGVAWVKLNYGDDSGGKLRIR